MKSITLNIPENSFLALKVPENDVENEFRMVAAVKLYELGRISSGAAAKIAQMPRTVFLSRLSDYGVDTFSFSEEDIEGETRLAFSYNG